jgi:amino acid adenylation domain-containing protein
MSQSIQGVADFANKPIHKHSDGKCAQWAHELVGRSADSAPDALAVRDEKNQLTFAELEQRANRLARHLQTLGVGAETPVGLYFERSVDFVVAALAVLKAGGAYVPLDAAYPPGRIDGILKDAGVPVLLSHKWMAASLAGGPWKTVDLDIDAGAIADHSAAPLDVTVAGPQLAYIAYTSGSTGRPKGVEVSHANLQHLISWHQRAFSVSPNDRASQVAGLAFDAAVWEMWCHLCTGASLHLIDEVSRRSAEGLKDWLVAQKITVAFVPTIMAEHLITFDWPHNTALRLLLTGADTLHRYPSAGLPFILVNNYGPTECTVLVTSGPVLAGQGDGQIPPIGRPIEDMEIVLMDAELQPVAMGGEGEICAAGPQVARGYRNLPELTAEKFVSQPGTGRRIYRTGDRGRLLADGQIAFLGRIDDQIKIRGFRVETDEIVAQLNAHPQIGNSIVIARGDSADEKSLVAYITPVAGAKLTANEVREHLRSRVPEYMVPSAFVSVLSLPVTATGKCDKEALPAPSLENLLPELSALAPDRQNHQSGTESRIAQLVSGLMDGRPVGREDNFFLIGGHSMLAAQLLARVRENLAVSLNLRQLFEAPTIASLALVVDRKLATK